MRSSRARATRDRIVPTRAGSAVDYEIGRATDVDPSNVETRDEFARFLSAVLADFRSTGETEWENGTLDRFLDGSSAFADARSRSAGA